MYNRTSGNFGRRKSKCFHLLWIPILLLKISKIKLAEWTPNYINRQSSSGQHPCRGIFTKGTSHLRRFSASHWPECWDWKTKTPLGRGRIYNADVLCNTHQPRWLEGLNEQLYLVASASLFHSPQGMQWGSINNGLARHRFWEGTFNSALETQPKSWVSRSTLFISRTNAQGIWLCIAVAGQSVKLELYRVLIGYSLHLIIQCISCPMKSNTLLYIAQLLK